MNNNIIMRFSLFWIFIALLSCSDTTPKIVSQETMQKVYEEVKTPFKYGIVVTAPDSTKMADSPTVFRLNGKWYMTYIIFDGTGYETWIAESDDLLQWETRGKIMSFTENTWDSNQKAGYPALVDITWNGTYAPMKYNERYWISYLGGADKGYEAGRLGVGMAYTGNIAEAKELERLPQPVLSAIDSSSRWYDNKTIFKSSVIHDADKKSGYPFVMYYNAAGDSTGANGHSFESIAMAVSNDMQHWQRKGDRPLLSKGRGICGDAQIVKMKDLYVMFYFGHNWKDDDPSAFDRFACSYDLVNWTEWDGQNLIEPSEPYDKQYAHKPWVIKWNGVVYHFYNAVGEKGRVIALATSEDLREKE
ncbi:glycosylase [Agriterribacter humi]|uniref:glycosylase n=1 Tax=Agriterribacter humi TaxID=1104781 RepID=UPI001D00797B|nr:glycosylase [Agriterribacter humi]